MAARLQTYLLSLSLLILTACGGTGVEEGDPQETLQTPVLPTPATPSPLPTIERTELPVDITRRPSQASSGIISTETSATLRSPRGFIHVPTGVGDAGHYYIYAGKIIELEWLEAPLSCSEYKFTYRALEGQEVLIAADTDAADGVSITWQVPEHLSAEDLKGVATCGEHTIQSHAIWSVRSGSEPPAGVCVVASSTIASVELHAERSLEASIVGYLAPGDYARVIEAAEGGWYRVETDHAEPFREGVTVPPVAWLSDYYPVEFFGPCE